MFCVRFVTGVTANAPLPLPIFLKIGQNVKKHPPYNISFILKDECCKFYENTRGATFIHGTQKRSHALCSGPSTASSITQKVRRRVMGAFALFTAPSVIHLTGCVLPGSQHSRLSVSARTVFIFTSMVFKASIQLLL